MDETDPLRIYVKRCLAMGYTKGQIRDRLLDAGYDMPTADSVLEGDGVPFSATPTVPTHQRLLVISGVLTFVIVAAVALVYLRMANPAAFSEPDYSALQPKAQPSGTIAPETNYPSPTVAPAAGSRPSTPSSDSLSAAQALVPARIGWPVHAVQGYVSSPPGSAACANYACMASAATDCTPRQLTHIAPLDFDNVTANTTQIITIGASGAGGCMVWFQTIEQHITYYQEYADELQQRGITASQVDQLEAASNSDAKRSVPILVQCTVPRDKLALVFTAWSQHSFMTKPLTDAGCQLLYG